MSEELTVLRAVIKLWGKINDTKITPFSVKNICGRKKYVRNVEKGKITEMLR